MNNPLPSDYWIADISLANKGRIMVEQTMIDMPGLTEILKKYEDVQPLKNINISGCVIITYETAAFILTLKKLGANIRWCSDNRFASVDESCAYIASQGIPVFAKKGETQEEFFYAMERCIEFKDYSGNKDYPDYIIDDGCDLSMFLHNAMPNILQHVKGITEQTTCGINSFYKLKNSSSLKVPVININESVTKSKFDNIYGSRESLIEGIQGSYNIQIGGKNVVIFGYGEVGKGCSQTLKGMGAHIKVVEVDPIVAMQAHMDGIEIKKKIDASLWGDIFISATGCNKTIDISEIDLMKDGAILMNMGHGNMEINTNYLNSDIFIKTILNANSTKYININTNKSVILLANGYLVNLVSGNGHPPRVMSITFTNHLMGILEFINHPEQYKGIDIYKLSTLSDEEAARLNFPEIINNLETLTQEQSDYLGVLKTGPFKREDYRY